MDASEGGKGYFQKEKNFSVIITHPQEKKEKKLTITCILTTQSTPPSLTIIPPRRISSKAALIKVYLPSTPNLVSFNLSRNLSRNATLGSTP